MAYVFRKQFPKAFRGEARITHERSYCLMHGTIVDLHLRIQRCVASGNVFVLPCLQPPLNRGAADAAFASKNLHDIKYPIQFPLGQVCHRALDVTAIPVQQRNEMSRPLQIATRAIILFQNCPGTVASSESASISSG